MADKEATVYIVDVGASMGKRSHGREQSDLDWAMKYVWDKITSTVSHGLPNWQCGLVELIVQGSYGTEDSHIGRDWTEDSGYELVSRFSTCVLLSFQRDCQRVWGRRKLCPYFRPSRNQPVRLQSSAPVIAQFMDR